MTTSALHFIANSIARYWDDYCGTGPFPFPHRRLRDEILPELSRIVRRDDMVSISAKPLPPKGEIWAAKLAFYVLSIHQNVMEVRSFMPGSEGEKMEKDLTEWSEEFLKFCGYKSKAELFNELLKKLKVKFPPIPEPEPGPDWMQNKLTINEKIIVGSIIATFGSNDAIRKQGSNLFSAGLE